jgi:carboxyl-terminal processing protease
MKPNLRRALSFSIIVIIGFAIGFFAQDVGAQLQGLPSQFELMSERSDRGKTEITILQSYYDVMSRLRDTYYGRNIDERQLTYSAIRGMLGALEDPYTRFLDPAAYKQMREENEGNFVGIGAQLDVNKSQQVYIKEPLPDSPAIKAGVKAGDIILKVDDKPVAGLGIEQVVQRIRGTEGTKVKLTLLRGPQKKVVDITIVRRLVEFRMVRSKMLDKKDGIGYIRLLGFNEHSDAQFDRALTDLEKQNMKGLVFDLRQNPGGLLQVAIQIGSRFIDKGPIVIIQERSGRRTSLDVDPSRRNHRQYPLIVLVDQQSASASEIVSGAIQDNNAGTLVGTRTFGKARVQTIHPLLDGSAVAITTAKYLTPKGRDINKVGVQPDVVVEGSETAELGDPATDPQLAKAISLMKEKLGAVTPAASVASH